MRITSLTLRNFKAIGTAEQRIEFRPITLLFGPNSAGKSTIVQALHYMSEILARNNCDPGTTQIGGKLNLGGFRNLVHLHDPDSTIELSLGLALDTTLLPSYGTDEDEHLLLGQALDLDGLFDISQAQHVAVRLGVSWSHQNNWAYVSSYTVEVDGEYLATIVSDADRRRIYLDKVNYIHPMFGGTEISLRDDLASRRVQKAFNSVGIPYQESDGEERSISDALRELVEEFSAPGMMSLQLSSGRSALPEFGRSLPLASTKELLSKDVFQYDPVANPELYEQDMARSRFTALNYYLSRLIVGSGELARDCLQQFLYLGPLREIPGRHYIPELSPGLVRWSSGLGAWDQFYNEGERLVGKVNAWLADDRRLDAGYEVHFTEYKPLSIDSPLMIALQNGSEQLEESDWVLEQLKAIPTRRQVTLRDQRTNIDLHPEDLGTGISQVLPVLVAALGHNKNIVAIEQPELHVHPKFQVALGELFIHAVKDERIAPNTVFILETHSEYMMLRFLRRLYETANGELEPEAHDLTPDDIGVYYVNPAGDSTEIVHLRLTEEGEFLDLWPNGFFPERKKELF